MDTIRMLAMQLEQKDLEYISFKVWSELIPYVGKDYLDAIDFKKHFLLCLINEDFDYFYREHLNSDLIFQIATILDELEYGIIREKFLDPLERYKYGLPIDHSINQIILDD